MTAEQAIEFVRTQGIVLESAQGPVPNFAETVAGEPLRGSWWGHRKSHEIFTVTRAVRDSGDVLVCRLVGGKITYVHRRLWPALVRSAHRFDAEQLGAVREFHSASGKHEVHLTPFPDWVPSDVKQAAAELTEQEANSQLAAILDENPKR